MLKPYRTVQDVLSSPWAQVQRAKSSSQQTDRVLRSTKLEDSIYRDLRMEDTGMDEIENSAGEKLRSFPALSRDIFQSFYSLNWMTYFPNWAENPALYRRWKSWSRQRKPQRTSSRHCWSSFVGLRRTIRL